MIICNEYFVFVYRFRTDATEQVESTDEYVLKLRVQWPVTNGYWNPRLVLILSYLLSYSIKAFVNFRSFKFYAQ